MTMTDVINVRDVLQDATTFGPDQVARIRTAIARKGLEEVRQHARELREQVENGDASEEVRRALGVISYLLADHVTADECLSSLPGDGIAECFHAKSLISLER